MADIATASERLKETAWRRWSITHGARLFATIRGRILIAFLAMSIITGAVGAYAALGMKHAGAQRRFEIDHLERGSFYCPSAVTTAERHWSLDRDWLRYQRRSTLDF